MLALSGCASLPEVPTTSTGSSSDSAEIKKVLQDQVVAWNSGDLAGFMATYAPLESTRFVSGGTVTHGWQTVFDRYRARYPDAATMGRVVFSDVQIEFVAAEFAFVSGAWRLEREGTEPSGRFSLLFRRFPEGWRIVYDHTSAAEP